jgi:cytochrome c-type biogenesis protein
VSSATLAAAFGAGVLSFATPCVLPLVPAYLAAVGGGVSVDDLRERRDLAQTLRGVAPFILGFGAVFVFFGALVGAAGSWLDDWRGEVAQAAGIIVVAMGLALAGVLPLPSLPGLAGSRSRPPSALLLGGVFALSWTPCVGPVLAAVLALASTRGGALSSALLLGAYAAGLAVPLIATAVAFDRTLGAAAFLRDRYVVIRVFSGIVLVILGLLVFFDRTWWLSVAVSRILRTVGLDGLTT